MRNHSVAGKSNNASNNILNESDSDEKCVYVLQDVSEEKIQRALRMTKNQK